MVIFHSYSGYVKIAIEHGPVEIVDLPIHSMVDLSSLLCKCLPEGIHGYPILVLKKIYEIPISYSGSISL
jgi:hypothetical protein